MQGCCLRTFLTTFWLVSCIALDLVGRPSIVPWTIDVLYYWVIWTDNGNTLPETSPRRQEGKQPLIKVLVGCILKLLLHSVNSVLILYGTGNMQSAIFLSFVASSSLPPCGLQSTHLPMPCYISPYIVLLRLDSSRRRRSFLEKKRKIEKGPEKSAYYDKLV